MLVILWTAFPAVFAAVASTLYVPLTLVAFGVIARGAAFAFRKAIPEVAAKRLFGAAFAFSSLVTPFFLGTVAGAVASGRVPPGSARGDPLTSWWNPTSVLGGALAVGVCAYLPAVYLPADAERAGQAALAERFRRRALGTGVAVGALALAGIGVLAADAPRLYQGLTGRALPLVATSAAFGLASLALVLGLRRLAPMVPGSLVAVLLGIAAVAVLDLDAHGVAIVGQIDSGLPALGPPDVAAADYLKLAAAAAGVMLVGFAEGLGAAKTYAARHHYEVDANRELLGLGAANLGSGLSSGMVVNGSLSKTAVNGGAGARSQVSGLVVAGLTILTLLFLTGLFESLPQATLAAVVIAAVIELVDIAALTALWRIATRQLRGIYGIAARPDFIAAVAALAGVLVFDTLPGLVIGVVVSLLLLLYRASRPHVAVLGQVPGMPGQYGDLLRAAGASTKG